MVIGTCIFDPVLSWRPARNDKAIIAKPFAIFNASQNSDRKTRRKEVYKLITMSTMVRRNTTINIISYTHVCIVGRVSSIMGKRNLRIIVHSEMDESINVNIMS